MTLFLNSLHQVRSISNNMIKNKNHHRKRRLEDENTTLIQAGDRIQATWPFMVLFHTTVYRVLWPYHVPWCCFIQLYTGYSDRITYQGVVSYIEINTWHFPYQPGYHPETPIWTRDTVDGLYGWRDDSRDDMENVMYSSFYHILPTNRLMKEIIKWIHMEVYLCIQQIHFQNTIVKREHLCIVMWFCLSLSCVLCTQCCKFLWIIHS
jgi:hypothetical protein